MIFLDVATGPIFAVMGVTFLVAVAVIAVIVLVAVKLIKKVVSKNKKGDNEK